MGNKMCKKKTDTVDNPKSSSSRFDRIFTRLHLKPAWKSESHLNKKQVGRYNDMNSKENMNNIKKTRPLSKSSDWTQATLEVPGNEEPVHLRNPKLSLIFNDNSTPTPPPRKVKQGIREKIESVAKTGLQAFQMKKPVEEPLFTKKIVNQTCPLDDHDCAIHNRKHKHDNKSNKQSNSEKQNNKETNKENKRRKNLSVVSLPNYNELKLTVATFDDIDKKPDPSSVHNSMLNIASETKPKLSHAASTGRLESYMTRCRSFGSILPQQLLEKLRTPKRPADIESDDSFGGLEDWDLKIIEHYNPKDASLPRPRKLQRNDKEVISDLESLIVKDDVEPPKPPIRRSESLVKKINKEASERAVKRKIENDLLNKTVIVTPSSTPKTLLAEDELPPVNIREEDDKIEHSSLMKILEEFSIKDKRKPLRLDDETIPEMDDSIIQFIDAPSTKNTFSLSPRLKDYHNNVSSVENFIQAEKMRTSKDMFNNYGGMGKVTT